MSKRSLFALIVLARAVGNDDALAFGIEAAIGASAADGGTDGDAGGIELSEVTVTGPGGGGA